MNKNKFIANLVLLGFKESFPVFLKYGYRITSFSKDDVRCKICDIGNDKCSYVDLYIDKKYNTTKYDFQDSLAKIIEHLNK